MTTTTTTIHHQSPMFTTIQTPSVTVTTTTPAISSSTTTTTTTTTLLKKKRRNTREMDLMKRYDLSENSSIDVDFWKRVIDRVSSDKNINTNSSMSLTKKTMSIVEHNMLKQLIKQVKSSIINVFKYNTIFKYAWVANGVLKINMHCCKYVTEAKCKSVWRCEINVHEMTASFFSNFQCTHHYTKDKIPTDIFNLN